MRIAIILGTRPEVMKNWSIVRALRNRGIYVRVLHTNQHYDREMNSSLFEQLNYRPDQVFPGAYKLGAAIDWVRDYIVSDSIDLLIVNGDTAAALVGALAALYEDVQVAHVESGLRSGDSAMIEERNRIMVDMAAHYLFCYTLERAAYLSEISEIRGRIVCVGNTTVDLIESFASHLVPQRSDRYAFVTLHRKEFTDSAELMQTVFATLRNIAFEFDAVVFPLHPRTRDAMKRYGIPMSVLSGIEVVMPMDPLSALRAEKYADVIITDSGCIQEEAYLFGVPCVTVRENTERPETLLHGANIVSGFDSGAITRAIRMQRSRGRLGLPLVYGTPGVAERIVDVLVNSQSYLIQGDRASIQPIEASLVRADRGSL